MIAEIVVGAIVGISFSWHIGFTCLFITGLCSALWRLGGADGFSKSYRRVGVPAVICTTLLVTYNDPLFIASSIAMWGVLSIGYGIPDVNDPNGSALGRFVLRFVNDVKIADVLIRTFIGLLIGLSLIPMAFHDLGVYVIGVVCCSSGMGLVRYLKVGV